MSLLDANAESLRETALNSSAPPPKPADPGIFQNFIPGAGNYFMRGMAESGRALSMAGAAVPVLADKLIGSDNRGESFGDRYFRWHDETFGRAVDYWTPKPGEVGAAGQVVGSLAAGLTQFLANPALLIGTAQLSTAEDLVRQGVDAGAANVAGDVAALSTLAGIALPIFGKTLAGKIATGAAGNLATNIPQAAITRAVVQAAGAPDVAAQFDPWDVRARTVDLLMGVAFGAKSHIDARAAAKTQAFLEGGIPSKPTAIAVAAAQAFESPLTATQRDAIMVMNAARHMDEAALPWKAGEAEHTAAVDNVRTAIAQISRGQEVDVPPIPRGPVTDNPNFRAWPSSASLTDHADLAQSIAESAPKSAEPVAAPEMRVHDVEKAMKTAQALSATIDAASADPATRVRLLKSEAQRLRSTADTAPTPDIAAHAKMAADMLENRAVFADDLRVPSGEFDPATGAPKTISANESIAKATAEAEHVKATAEGLMRTVATCILGGI